MTLNRSSERAAELAKKMVASRDVEPTLATNYLMKGWLDRRCQSILYGASNAGKTFVVLDMAMHVAANLPWRGHRVRGGAVLYIAAEGQAGINNRIAAIKADKPDLADADLDVLPSTVDLYGSQDALAICEAISGPPPVLIIVDTLARAMGGGDENTAKDAAVFLANCKLIEEATGAHVMVVHHSGKDSDKGARGSSAFRGAVDTEISVTADGKIESHKQRDQPKPDPLYFSLRPVVLGVDEDGEEVTSAVVDAADPPKATKKPLTGKNEVAIQALDDALREHGSSKSGNFYPVGRKVVHIDHWRAACKVHGLTGGASESSERMAFKRAKDKLMDLNEVREWGDHVWRVQEDD
ncbi:MAG: helicase RepA family protein [Pseudomonadota bacterium]